MKRNTQKSKRLAPIKVGDKTMVPIVTGTQARTFTGGTGARQLGAIRVFIQMQMSKLDTSSDTLEICLFAGDPRKVVNQAADILKTWYKGSGGMFSEGYPKPKGDGTMELLEDRDFAALYRDAQRLANQRGDELKVLGPKYDPTAFHVMRREKRIILPGSMPIIQVKH